jgi:hypothetical protein
MFHIYIYIYIFESNICNYDNLETQETGKFTSSRTMADIKAIKRFRLNSWPVESTAADLKEKKNIKNKLYLSLLDDLTSQKKKKTFTCQRQYQR